MSKSVIVFGGAGFLGKRLCQAFYHAGYAVTSVSRSGKAPPVESHHDAAWIHHTNWAQGDVFNPSTYAHLLRNPTAVVHSIGILFENPAYKKVVHANGSPCENRAAVTAMISGVNPMTKSPTSSYDAMNYQSALTLATAVADANADAPTKPAFVYISADQQVPFIPVGYLQTKRKAETDLSAMATIRPIMLRPGMMYDAQVGLGPRSVVKSAVDLVRGMGELTGTLGLFGTIVRPVISTQKVAQTATSKVGDPTYRGVVTLDEMSQP